MGCDLGCVRSDGPGHVGNGAGHDQSSETPVEDEEDAAGAYGAKDRVGGSPAALFGQFEC